MQTLRGIGILGVFVITALLLIPVQSTALALKLRSRKSIPQIYSRFLCRLFGVRIQTIGSPVQGKGVLMIANHTSYLDIIVLGASARVSFVAKSEVNTWPFFGKMARLYETVFVERSRRTQVGVARDQLRRRLDEGDALVLFPEGTSNDGNRVLPFKSALMAAAEAQLKSPNESFARYVPVQPVSLAYVGYQGIPMGRENRPLFAWYGDMDLVPHLWEAVTAGPVDVVVEFHPPMTVDSMGGRKPLAVRAESQVREGQARALAGISASSDTRPEPAIAQSVPHRA